MSKLIGVGSLLKSHLPRFESHPRGILFSANDWVVAEPILGIFPIQ